LSEQNQQDEETRRRARNRSFLLIATIVFVLANVVSIAAFVINTNYVRTHMTEDGRNAASAQP
jgi:multidrug resistance efflux pump